MLMMCRYCEDWWQAAILPAGSCAWRAPHCCSCW